MSKFKRGDRVKVVKTEDDDDLPLGWEGTIVAFEGFGNVEGTYSMFLDKDPGPPAYNINEDEIDFLEKD